jgi:hypothetical protein
MTRFKTFHIGENIFIKKGTKIFFIELIMAIICVSLLFYSLLK